MPDLSLLERMALGVVFSKAPCTRYAIRRVFLDSPSSHWSGSAGAIYPLVARLESRRLLRSAAARGDGRATRLYSLTPAGLKALRHWLAGPLTPEDASVPFDPLRARIFFLDALPPDDQQRLLAAAAAALADSLRAAEEHLQRDDVNAHPSARLGALGALAAARARADWITSITTQLAPRAH